MELGLVRSAQVNVWRTLGIYVCQVMWRICILRASLGHRYASEKVIVHITKLDDGSVWRFWFTRPATSLHGANVILVTWATRGADYNYRQG